MEPNEAQELQEQAEHGSQESSLRPVALTMTILAVLVAVTTVLGHRTHTEAILNQDKATDTWNEYQAHKIRANDTKLTAQLLSVVAIADKEKAKQLTDEYSKSLADKKDETKDDMAKALDYEKKVEEAEAKGNRFDLGEALLEIGLVITSVTLLTRKRVYWYFGMAFALGGIVSAVSVLLLQ